MSAAKLTPALVPHKVTDDQLFATEVEALRSVVNAHADDLDTLSLSPNRRPGFTKSFRYLSGDEISANGGHGEAFDELVYLSCCIQTRVYVEFYQPDPAKPVKYNAVLVPVYDAAAPPDQVVHVDGSFRPGDVCRARFVLQEDPAAQYGYVRPYAPDVSFRLGELIIYTENGTTYFARSQKAGLLGQPLSWTDTADWLRQPTPTPNYGLQARLSLSPADARDLLNDQAVGPGQPYAIENFAGAGQLLITGGVGGAFSAYGELHGSGGQSFRLVRADVYANTYSEVGAPGACLPTPRLEIMSRWQNRRRDSDDNRLTLRTLHVRGLTLDYAAANGFRLRFDGPLPPEVLARNPEIWLFRYKHGSKRRGDEPYQKLGRNWEEYLELLQQASSDGLPDKQLSRLRQLSLFFVRWVPGFVYVPYTPGDAAGWAAAQVINNDPLKQAHGDGDPANQLPNDVRTKRGGWVHPTHRRGSVRKQFYGRYWQGEGGAAQTAPEGVETEFFSENVKLMLRESGTVEMTDFFAAEWFSFKPLSADLPVVKARGRKNCTRRKGLDTVRFRFALVINAEPASQPGARGGKLFSPLSQELLVNLTAGPAPGAGNPNHLAAVATYRIGETYRRY